MLGAIAAAYDNGAVIVGMMRNLMRKSDHNQERWQIHKTKRAGPKDISFWRQNR